MSFFDYLKNFLIDWIKKIPLIIAALLILGLIGAGLGVGILLRELQWDMTAIVVPSLIVEVITCIIAYQFASNFFPKAAREFSEPKKSQREYKEPEKKEASLELPERKVNS